MGSNINSIRIMRICFGRICFECRQRICFGSGGVSVYLDCECMEFAIAGLYKMTFCNDQQTLVMIIWLVLTRVESEEISY